MTNIQFRAHTRDGKEIEPQTAIFPIMKEVSGGENRLVGTGFFITTIGHFVTAKHVIEEAGDLATGKQKAYIHAVHFVEGTKVLVRHITKVSFHPAADVAVGKMDYYRMDDTGRPLMNLVPTFTTEIPRVGSTVVTYAYPESSPGEFVVGYYSGKLTGHSVKPRDARLVTWPHFTTSIDLGGGASGGPVFDERGRVFGINCVGGIQNYSCMARVNELLPLSVPEFPGDRDVTVLDLVKSGSIRFEPTIA